MSIKPNFSYRENLERSKKEEETSFLKYIFYIQVIDVY